MAGIAILLDMWRKNQNVSPGLHSAHAFQSSSFFSASAAAGAAATFAAGTSFASRALFGATIAALRVGVDVGCFWMPVAYGFSVMPVAADDCCCLGSPIAYCDAGAPLSEDYISNIQHASGKIDNFDGLRYSTTKQYNVELKPLFSAFELRSFAMTSIRSFLMFYLPLLEPRAEMEDDEDFLEENQEQQVDLVVPLKKSVKQIIRETTVVTTRRILERVTVHYVSQRMAWKLLKDVPRSATRKAGRKMPILVYFFCVSRTTFRGHMLGVAASWLVQVGIEVYRFFNSMFKSEDEDNDVYKANLAQKISIATIRCTSSLIFASIGAGIGATLFRPSLGQWIGCAAGDLAGPIIVAFCADQLFQVKL